jgi:hypothetical protein
MATRADMGRLKSKLQTSGDFRWVIEGLPVVAQYSHPGRKRFEHLGHFPGHNNNSDSLKMWIGVSEQAAQLLVTLTFRINAGAGRRSRKKARSKGRLMFLVVPTESLSLKSKEILYNELNSNEGLRELMDSPSDVKSGDCTVLDLSFDVPAAKSRVIMMKNPLGHSLQPQPLVLIRKLKRLSEVSAFHLYANFDQNVQSSIASVQAMLGNCSTIFNAPGFDFENFYAGSCEGAFDTWTDQGWTRDEEDMAPSIDQNHSWRSSPPPAYVPKPSRGFPYPAQNKIDHLNHHDPLPSSRKPKSSLPTEQACSSNYTADLLADLSAGSMTRTSDSSTGKNSICEFTTRTPYIVPQTLSCVSQHSWVSKRSVVGLSSPSIVLDTPTRKRPLCPPTESVGGSDTKRLSRPSITGLRPGADLPPDGCMYYRGVMFQAVTLQSSTEADTVCPTSLHLSVPQSDSNATAMSPVSAASLHTTPVAPMSYHWRMTLWLERTWNLYPFAHYKFIAKLLRLGDAAHRDDVHAFHDCLVASTVAATEHCARDNVRTSTTCAPNSITEERARETLRSLASWLHALDVRAELDTLPDLVKFSALQQRAVDLPAEHRAGYGGLIGECTQLRASIVTSACIQLGHRVLGRSEQDERDILSQMSQEEERSRTWISE